MGKPEASVEKYFRQRVKEEGGQQRKVRFLCRRGAPDRLLWWTFPQVAWVELKSADGGLESSQEREFPKLVKGGWPLYVVSSKEQVDQVIQEVKHGNKA